MLHTKDEINKLNNFIDGLNLEKNNLSEKEIGKIKKSLKKTLKKYYASGNGCFSIDSLDKDKINVESIISEKNKEYKIGVCNTEFLKMLVNYGSYEFINNKEDLIYKDLFLWDIRKGYVLDIDEMCYIYLIITTSEIILLELDNYFRVIKVNRKSHKEIRNVKFNSHGSRIYISFIEEDEKSERVGFSCWGGEYNKILEICESLKLDITIVN